jgi:peptidyl-prolyl cis-trans isomerase D
MVMNALRNGAKNGFIKFILFGLLIMAMGGLVLMDVGGFFTNKNIANSAVVTIGNDKLTAAEFDRIVRNTLYNQGIDVQAAYEMGIVDQILDARISQTLLSRSAQENGIVVGDTIIAQYISQLVAPYVNDETTPKQALVRLLASQGLTEASFVNSIRTEMSNGIIRNLFGNVGSVYNEDEVNDLYQYNNETRSFNIITLNDDYKNNVEESTDEVLMPIYQSGIEKYAIPETRKITISVLDYKSMTDGVSVTDEDLLALYNKQIEQYILPETRSLEQAILNEKAQASDIVDLLNKKTSLEEAVQSVTGNKDSYLGIADFDKATLTKEVGEKAFSSDENAVIGPVQSPLGWHVIVVKKLHEPRTRSFDEVKSELQSVSLQTKVAEQLLSTSAQIDDAIAAGTPLEEFAKELKMTSKSYGPLTISGTSLDGKEALNDYKDERNSILSAAFELMESDISHVIELKDGSYAVVRVDSVTEKSYKPFEDVKSDLNAVWKADLRNAQNKVRSEKAFLELQTGGKSLDDIAKEFDLKVTTEKLMRSDLENKDFSPIARLEIFKTAKNNYALVPTDKGFAIAQIKDITIPNPDKASKESLEMVRKSIENQVQEETYLLYMEYLRQKNKVRIHRGVLDQLYGQQAAESQ